jgi:hypothetical protein
MLALEGMMNAQRNRGHVSNPQMLAETSRAEDMVIDGEQIWLMRQATNMPGEP